VSEAVATDRLDAAERRARGPVMRAPAAALQEAAGATFVREAGWDVPAACGEPHAERRWIATTVGVIDVTPRGKIDVRGDVDAALSVVHGDHGVARVSGAWALVLTTPGPCADRVGELAGAARAGAGAMVTDATHLYAGYALAGPELPELLARVTSFDAAALAPGAGAGAPIVDVRAVWLRGRLALPLVEVYVPAELGRFAWGALVEAAHEVGGGPVGWDALRAHGWR
jgi:sarcosine oxidase, subunit alpha